MFSKKSLPIFIGILFLSGMFLLGQEAWNPLCGENDDCAPGDQFCGKPVGHCEGSGVCVDKPDACPEILDPVCGCDGITYDNSCFAAYVGVNVDYPGACKSSPRLEGYSNSGCLPGTKVNSTDDPYPWCGGDEVEVTVQDRTLQIIHLKATYNCCPDDIEVTLEVDGNRLNLTETEIVTNPCFCLCCFNVESTIVELSTGRYTVEYCWFDPEEEGIVCHTQEMEIP